MAALALGGATLALGGGGVIWDDGHAVQPGPLDDGKELKSQARISLDQAITAAQRAASGALGQVDLEQAGGGVVYVVDIGNQEVRVDADDAGITSVGPQS